MAGRQTTMPGVIPPLTLPQERAQDFLNAKKAAAIAQAKAKDAEEDMIEAAKKAGVDIIKVRDDDNNLIVFQLDNKIAVKKSVLTDVKIEKAETESLKK
ncbi:MAG: hypothetical protein PHS14_00005 [Elusimicrobia bacterium]|nr:hypothetical protein [Elusimicrobiota bacterium]